MKTENLVRLKLDGLASEEGHIRASDFQREIQLMLNILHKGECDLLRIRERTIYYRIIELRHSSPTTIVLEAQPLKTDQDKRTEFLSQLGAVMQEAESGKLSRKVETSVLRSLGNMAAPIGRTLAGVTVSVGVLDIRLTPATRKNVEAILAPEETFNGAFSGMLEYLNVHADANVFYIYPDIGPTKVRCNFPSELRESAIQAVGSFVEVSGVLKYKSTAPYPHEIEVGELAILEQDELPTFEDVRGIAKLPTGMTSEGFVRKVRNAL